MVNEMRTTENTNNEETSNDIIYSSDKDFYKGIGGELRLKAEGLFKKAKEKGISIEGIDIILLKENSAEFPGVGKIDLPTYIVKVKGRDIFTGQVIVDGKQIDYYNRYQKYLAQKIEKMNTIKDENSKPVYQNRKPKIKENVEFYLTDWEMFDIGKDLLDDKEFGLEKTITGACDRIIRKLMGENDWLYPEEARLLDEEFNSVQNKIQREQQDKRQDTPAAAKKKATPRQINYLKQRLKNMGMDPESNDVINKILREMGFESTNINELSIGEMSKIIDSLNTLVPKIKETLETQEFAVKQGENNPGGGTDAYKQ